MKLVHGVGFNDRKYITRIDGKNTVQYSLWFNMVARCYSPHMLKNLPTYRDCFLSDNFLDFSYFHEWFDNQHGRKLFDPNIDKDLIFKGNKIYSEDNCFILPPEVNGLFIKSNSKRGLYPIGVNFRKNDNKFVAQVNAMGKRKTIGCSKDPMECFLMYKYAKEKEIKRVASVWRDQISPKAYDLLMSYQVEITD